MHKDISLHRISFLKNPAALRSLLLGLKLNRWQEAACGD